MNNPLVGIVIVNYNGEKFQNDCISSILSSTYQNFYIIIVDNNSKDNSMSMLDVFKDERIIKIYENENWGVAKGNNLGINKSISLGTDYTLLLNNDTVLKPDTLENLIITNDDEYIKVPQILFWNSNLLWYAGGKFVKYKCVTKHLNFKKKIGIEVKKYYEYAPTCCMLIKNIVFQKIGLMDENYFLYFDDSDFCIRLKNQGYKINLCKDSIMYHKVSLSTGGPSSTISLYYENRNRFYFYKKHKRNFMKISYLYLNISKFLKYLIGIVKHDNRKIIKKAFKDFKKGNMGRCDSI